MARARRAWCCQRERVVANWGGLDPRCERLQVLLMYKIAVIALCLVLAGLQYRLWIAEGSYAEIHRLDTRIEMLSQQVESMRERNRKLAAEIANLKSGLAAMEGRARSELGMVAPGEKFYSLSGQE